MRLVFTPNGWQDYTHWVTADRTMLMRINRLMDDALRDPTSGIGKPEPMRHLLAGAWSRRITRNTAWSTSSTVTTWSSCKHASTTSDHISRKVARCFQQIWP